MLAKLQSDLTSAFPPSSPTTATAGRSHRRRKLLEGIGSGDDDGYPEPLSPSSPLAFGDLQLQSIDTVSGPDPPYSPDQEVEP